MKYCKNCGQELDDNATVCPNCNTAVEAQPVANQAPATNPNPQNTNPNPAPAPNPNDHGGFGWAFLGFCFPIVGLILFLVWKNSLPLRAKSCGKGALISVIIGAVIGVLSVIISISCAGAIAGAAGSGYGLISFLGL